MSLLTPYSAANSAKIPEEAFAYLIVAFVVFN
jgi:hypothetical protein